MMAFRIRCPSGYKCKSMSNKWSVYLGICLVDLWSETELIWGNLSVYTSSYLYYRVNNAGGFQTPWAVSFFMIFWMVGSLVCQTLNDRLGRRPACALGIALVNGGIYLSYFTVQYSAMTLALTMGALVGLGCGIITSTNIYATAEWTDKYIGLATAITDAVIYLASAISNQMISWYINPTNLKPDGRNGEMKYFSQAEILDRIPKFFLLLGTASLAANLIGLVFMRTRTDSDKDGESTRLLVEENSITTSFVENGDIGEDCRNDSNNNLDDYHSVSLRDAANGKQEAESSSIGSRNSIGNRFADVDYMPKEVLKTFSFYAISIASASIDFSILTVLSYYKKFGLIYIDDDHLLTNIGTYMIVSIGIITCITGLMADNLRLKTTYVIQFALLTCISAFYYLTPKIDKTLFGIITAVYGGIVHSNLSLSYVAVLKLYGATHFMINHGMSSIAGTVFNLAAPPLIEVLLNRFGWFSMFLSVATINFISLVLVIVGIPNV